MLEGNDIFEYYNISDNVVAMIPATPIKEIIEVTESVPTTCFALPNELVFIDCGAYPDLIKQFRSDMEERFQKEKCLHEEIIKKKKSQENCVRK